MNTRKPKYDVCVVSFSSPDTDARTLNFVNTLCKHNRKVCLIALQGSKAPADFDFDLITIPDDLNSRVFIRWYRFTQSVGRLAGTTEAGVVVAEDLFSLPAASKISGRGNAKLIYDSREIYSALGPIHDRRLKQKVLTFIESRYIKFVDEFIVSGKLDEDILRQHFNTGLPFHLVMNLPPFKKNIQSDLIRETFSIEKDKFIVLYQGAALPGRGLDLSVRAIGCLSNAHLCIIGDGPYLSKVKNDVSSLNLSHKVHFTGEISYSDLHKWTCSADVGLALFESVSKSYELALPNKLFEYCMASIPTIASDLPAMRRVISENKIGELFNMNLGAQELAARLQRILVPERLGALGKACSDVSRKFSYESQEETILRITDWD